MTKFSFLFTILSILFIPILSAQLTPEEAVAGMGRGINLGNTLEPPTESAWNNGPAQESYFDAYLEAGFTNIRIPVRWDKHTANNAPFEVDESWMDRVEQVIDWGLDRGFYITMNGHHEDWLKTNYDNTTLRDRYEAIWVQIAERFKDKSDHLLFEIINEPNGMTVAQVDDLNERILAIIRATNPTRIVIYGGNMYANAEQLFTAKIPDDDYIVGYYHAYDPWQFSGEGMGTWGSTFDYQQVTNKYQSVKEWSDANGIPIHHSEFGAVHTCDFNSRMRIYAHNVEQCIINGIAFSVWDDGGDFGVLNRRDNSWPEVKDILVHYHEDSPNQIFSTLQQDETTNEPAIKIEWNNRASNNGAFIVERFNADSNSFDQIAELPADATSYLDEEVDRATTYTYRMYTTRADGTILHGYPTRIWISDMVQSSFNETPIAIPGVLEVEEYDNGGEGLAYHDTDAANISAGFRLDEGVDIGSYGSGYILGYVAQGEWIEYTVDVAEAGTYTVNAETASEIADGNFSITFDKNNATVDFTTPKTGGWVNFQEITANDVIDLEAGKQTMRLMINNFNAFNLDHLTFNLQSVNVIDLEATQAGFHIYPNPAKNSLNVKLAAEFEKNSQLLLFNVTGEKIGVFEINGNFEAIDISQIPSGIYFLHLINDDVNLVHRLLIR
ncbi:cellulase family glycosylhydrolase [Portibacter lacus]|uniref:CBM6 domain-containing protein n=1 Tax=Portibacter lacus TaxID=1099794 RepID=A0AA37WHS6_9BACT|nr:cellulase family glycosylhydrolase [Portibacter lacus]GLR19874.1 hypothetical protein GCM10007940_44900 [Portibacter lacus]